MTVDQDKGSTMKGWELIQGLADRVIAEEPRQFAREILDKAAACLGARRAALFHRHDLGLGLFASRSLDQRVIDLVDWLWQNRRAALEEGQPFLASLEDSPAQAEVQAALTSGTTALLALPVRASERFVGLLYLDGSFAAADVVDGARALAEISAAALRAPSAPQAAERAALVAARVPSEEVLREQLLRVLEENEWNIARVARLMGLSRVTIYNRLARYDLERKKVPKGATALSHLTRLPPVPPSALGSAKPR
jgi:transcriptional regulator with GAF, ATPase, and Fis domain